MSASNEYLTGYVDAQINQGVSTVGALEGTLRAFSGAFADDSPMRHTIENVREHVAEAQRELAEALAELWGET